MVSIKETRRKIEVELLHKNERQYFSPVYLSQYRITVPLLKQYLRGRLLDIGCGDMPFKGIVQPLVTEYHGLDLYPRSDEVFYVQDVQDMVQVPDAMYDSVMCLEVLEHIPDPFRAVREIYRILKDDGIVVVSVPHLSRLHEEPHDYYRYTKYGLHHLLESGGFEVVQIKSRGGIFTFLGHQISTGILGLIWQVPVLKSIIWFINKWCVTILSNKLDNLTRNEHIFPAGYSAVARKTS